MQKRIPFSLAKKRLKRKYFLASLAKSLSIPLTVFALGFGALKYSHKKEMQRIEREEVRFSEKLKSDRETHDKFMQEFEQNSTNFQKSSSGKIPRFYFQSYDDYKNKRFPSKVEWVKIPTNEPSVEVGSSNSTNTIKKVSPYYEPVEQIFIGKKQLPKKRMLSSTIRSSLSKRRS